MKNKKESMEPPESWIRRGVELVPLSARVPQETKDRAEEAARILETSLNRFTEAALNWYMEALKQGKKL